MPLIARLGDPGTHGGNVCSSAIRSYAEDILIARVGDTYCCPIHGPNPIVTGCIRTWCEAVSIDDPIHQIAFDGSLTACGASIIATAQRTCVEGSTCP